VAGLRADRASIAWLAGAGVDAVISSHGQLMTAIRHEGMTAIHRLLLGRRSHLDTAVAAIGRSEPNIVEVLPGVILPSVVGLLPTFDVPVLAGGFIRTEVDVQAALSSGALGVTTSAQGLWGVRAA
jgi:glycerol uptake operon antiterminator